MASQSSASSADSDLPECQEYSAHAPRAGRYASALAARPCAVLTAMLLLVLSLSAVGFVVGGAPNFSDAGKGMDSREDLVWRRSMPMRFLHGETMGDDDAKDDANRLRSGLVANPWAASGGTSSSRRLAASGGSPPLSQAALTVAHRRVAKKMCSWVPWQRSPGESQTLRLVFELSAAARAAQGAQGRSRGLLAAAPLKAICKLVREFEAGADVDGKRKCARVDWGYPWDENQWGKEAAQPAPCCTARSVGEYIAALSSPPTSCDQLTDAAVDDFFAQRLQPCAAAYFGGALDGGGSDGGWALNGAAGVFSLGAAYDNQTRTGPASVTVTECDVGHAMYDVFYNLVDRRFLNPNEKDGVARSRAATMQAVITVPESTEEWWTHTALKQLDARRGGGGGAAVRLVAYHMTGDSKFRLFNKAIVADSMWAGVAFVFVGFILRSHMGSGPFAVAAMVQIILSVPLSYFIYFCIFQMPFFPFLNMVTLFLIIGIGADDVFVYVDTWKSSFALLLPRREQGETAVTTAQRLQWVLGRAGWAMLVTSATTAAAFFATAVSSITAIRCFGIFAGIVVIMDYCLMVSVLPCLVLLHHNCTHKARGRDAGAQGGQGAGQGGAAAGQGAGQGEKERGGEEVQAPAAASRPLHSVACAKVASCARHCVRGSLCAVPQDHTKRRWSEQFLAQSAAPFLIQWRAVFVPLFFALGVWGSVAAFAAPGLQLPTADGFQLFPSGHAMEQYDRVYKPDFEANGRTGTYPLQVFFGAAPEDNGDHLDPTDWGRLRTLPLNISSPAAQRWLMQFDFALRRQPFYSDQSFWAALPVPVFASLLAVAQLACDTTGANVRPRLGVILSANVTGAMGPAWTNVTVWNAFRRIGGSSSSSLSLSVLQAAGCCGVDEASDHIPGEATFNACVKVAARVQSDDDPWDAQFFFANDTASELKVLRLLWKSSQIYSQSYEKSDSFFTSVDGFVRGQVATAPVEIGGARTGLADGYFVTWGLDFYSLQRATSDGARLSITLSLALTFLVLFAFSENFVATLCAALTIFFILSCVLGVLVAKAEPWRLGVMESVCIMAAVGMCVDFVVHYTYAFVHSPKPDRRGRVADALQQMGLSLFCGMATTFVAALVTRVFTGVLFFHLFGEFLMLCMSLSWAFATFFLLPMLSAIGPEGDFDICPGGVSLHSRVRQWRKRKRRQSTPVPERPVAGGGVVVATDGTGAAREITV